MLIAVGRESPGAQLGGWRKALEKHGFWEKTACVPNLPSFAPPAVKRKVGGF